MRAMIHLAGRVKNARLHRRPHDFARRSPSVPAAAIVFHTVHGD